MQALFLDFDGVIVNSIDECYLISSEVYFKILKSTAPSGEIKELFYKHRGLVRPVHQFMLLFRAIESVRSGDGDDIERKFFELDRSVSSEEKDRFEAFFFDLRKNYQRDLAGWVAMNPLTPFGETLRGRTLPNSFFITTKDSASVAHIARHHDIKVGGTFDKEVYSRFGSKGKIISHFLDEKEEYDTAVFVDDAVEHLDSVEDSRIQCYFADWGYGKNREYPVYRQDLW